MVVIVRIFLNVFIVFFFVGWVCLVFDFCVVGVVVIDYNLLYLYL